MNTTRHARAERASLCDLLAEVGPDAPTLCEGWTTALLAAHLVVRERRPDGGPGRGVGGAGLLASGDVVLVRLRLLVLGYFLACCTNWCPGIAGTDGASS